MNCEKKFYRCNKCGNIVGLIHSGGGQLVCCGEPMQMLIPNTTDAALEKHVPVIIKEEGKITVRVGSVEHPMTEEHSIQWIYICCGSIGQRKALKPGDKPEAVFYVEGGDICEAYAFCNLHGLWSSRI